MVPQICSNFELKVNIIQGMTNNKIMNINCIFLNDKGKNKFIRNKGICKILF